MKSQSGIAISTILYMIIIVFGLVIVTYMSILVKNTDINRGAIDKVKTSLSVGNLSDSDKLVVKEYRYMKSDGTYSDWISYANKSHIDKTINLTTISNNGFMGDNYNLTSIGVELKLENGIGYLDFNGSTDRGDGVTNTTGFMLNTLYIEGVYNATSNMFISFNNTDAFLYNNDLDFSSPNADFRTEITENVTLGQKFKATLTWTSDEIYNIYVNGEKKAIQKSGSTPNHAYPLECLKIALGYGEYANDYYLDGRIYDLRLSSRILTISEAIAITSNDIDINSILGENSAEVIYGNFIQYREKVY